MQKRTILAFRPDAAEWQTLRELRAQTGLSYSRIIGTMLREKAEKQMPIAATPVEPTTDALYALFAPEWERQRRQNHKPTYGSELTGLWPTDAQVDAYDALRRDGVPRDEARKRVFV